MELIDNPVCSNPVCNPVCNPVDNRFAVGDKAEGKAA